MDKKKWEAVRFKVYCEGRADCSNAEWVCEYEGKRRVKTYFQAFALVVWLRNVDL
jgi:hypothetical protein